MLKKTFQKKTTVCAFLSFVVCAQVSACQPAWFFSEDAGRKSPKPDAQPAQTSDGNTTYHLQFPGVGYSVYLTLRRNSSAKDLPEKQTCKVAPEKQVDKKPETPQQP